MCIFRFNFKFELSEIKLELCLKLNLFCNFASIASLYVLPLLTDYLMCDFLMAMLRLFPWDMVVFRFSASQASKLHFNNF